MIRFWLLTFCKPGSQPVFSVFVVDNDVLELLLDELFLTPVVQYSLFDFFQVNFFLEGFQFFDFKFPEDSQKGFGGHVEQFAISDSCDT